MFEHARRLNEPFSLVMCDLDRFKTVNDTHGHQAGDVVLKQFAKILRGEIREIDRARLNVDGGAISLGHPVGTSGNRIVLHLVNAMKRLGTKRGIATECIGGGLGGAMLIETV